MFEEVFEFEGLFINQ